MRQVAPAGHTAGRSGTTCCHALGTSRRQPNRRSHVTLAVVVAMVVVVVMMVMGGGRGQNKRVQQVI